MRALSTGLRSGSTATLEPIFARRVMPATKSMVLVIS